MILHPEKYNEAQALLRFCYPFLHQQQQQQQFAATPISDIQKEEITNKNASKFIQIFK